LDFKEFIRLCGMAHVKTWPYYRQSNGKIERFHRAIKGDGLRTEAPLSLADAPRVVARYVGRYTTVRLHSAIGFVTPQAKLEGRDEAIREGRDRKLEAARASRGQKRQAARPAAVHGQPASPTT
jgi:transposase InsO family protein